MYRKSLIKITLIMLTVALFVFIYYNSPLRANKNFPLANGTFIQLDLAQNWDESKWNSELHYIKQNKMDYIIITGVSFSSDNGPKAVYKSNIPGFTKVYGQADPIDLCLKTSEKLGLKVFVDTYFNNDWWEKSGDDSQWLYDQVYKINQVSDELYNKYHSKYPSSFYGWYFPYEVDNAKFNNIKQFSILSNAININLRYLKSKNERLPILLSPFMNSSCGTAKEYANNWTYFFAHTDLIKGDIFCVQDAVGSGRLSLNEVNPWFTALRKSVNSKPGLLFWANAENFDYVNNSSVPINRFVEQLKLESPCVDNIVTFSYSHYYSPNNIDKGFQMAYYDYVSNGKLSVHKPKSPENLAVKTLNKNEFLVSWEAPKDNDDICGYNVYRDGILVFNTTVQRRYGGDPKGIYMNFTDRPLLKNNMYSCNYEVKSFDFYGNLSDSSPSVKVIINADKELPNLLSKGCRYTIYPLPDYNYNDPYFTKLTDGVYSSSNSNKDKAFVGWYGKPVDITMDLGKKTDLQQISVSYLRDPLPWIQLPDSASVSVSNDGLYFEPIGLLRIPSVPYSERSGSKYKIYLTLDKPVSAKYVRLSSFSNPSTYMFMDELEIRSN